MNPADRERLWRPRRKGRPYTAKGIARLACVRCGERAHATWGICADGNQHRPLCKACDVALNAMVLRWAKHPDAANLIATYKRKVAAA